MTKLFVQVVKKDGTTLAIDFAKILADMGYDVSITLKWYGGEFTCLNGPDKGAEK